MQILQSWHVWRIHSANTRNFTSFMVSSGLSCSTMAWSCRRRASDAASFSLVGEVGEEADSSSTSSLLPSSSRWTAPFTRAKLSLGGGGWGGAGHKTSGWLIEHRASSSHMQRNDDEEATLVWTDLFWSLPLLWKLSSCRKMEQWNQEGGRMSVNLPDW